MGFIEDHSTIIVTFVGSAWALISALVLYVWKNQGEVISKRIIILEDAHKALVEKSVADPMMSTAAHNAVCSKNTTDVTAHLSTAIDSSAKLIQQRISLLEENLILKIERAILQSYKNGKA